MSKRDELIAIYKKDLTEKCGVQVDDALLQAVTIGCGPAIYNADSSTISGTSDSELETVKNNFLIKKLGLTDSPELMSAIQKAIDTYGRSNPKKYRAVMYYLLAVHFKKQDIYSSKKAA